MKQLLIIFCIAFLCGSCKKDTGGGNTGGNPAVTNTPNLITPGYQPGQPFNVFAFNIFDLNHDDNKDKKYFTVVLYGGDNDSAVVTRESKPIDSLSPGWPADVKKIAFGSGAEFVIDTNSFIKLTGGVFKRIQYDPLSPQHTWVNFYKNLQKMFRNSNLPFPGYELLRNQPGGTQLYRQYFLGVDGGPLVSVVTGVDAMGHSTFGTRGIEVLDPMNNSFGSFDYTYVTQMIYLDAGAFPKYYFFDFKNWEYFIVSKSQGILNPWHITLRKSLDKFCKWPEGWGKK
jgi:hypothetical protein